MLRAGQRTPSRGAKEPALGPAGARSNDGKADHHAKTPLKSALKKPQGLVSPPAPGQSAPRELFRALAAEAPVVPALRQFDTASSCGTLNSVGATVVSSTSMESGEAAVTGHEAAAAAVGPTPRSAPQSLRRFIQPVATTPRTGPSAASSVASSSTPRGAPLPGGGARTDGLDGRGGSAAAGAMIPPAAALHTFGGGIESQAVRGPADPSPSEHHDGPTPSIPAPRVATPSTARIATGQSAIEAFRRAFQGLSTPPIATPASAREPDLPPEGRPPVYRPSPFGPPSALPFSPAIGGIRPATLAAPQAAAVPGAARRGVASSDAAGVSPAPAQDARAVAAASTDALNCPSYPEQAPASSLSTRSGAAAARVPAMRSRWRLTLRAIGRAHRARPSSSSSMAPQAGTLRGTLAPAAAERSDAAAAVGGDSGPPLSIDAADAALGGGMYDDFTDSLPAAPVAGAAPALQGSSDLSRSPVGGDEAVFGINSDALNADGDGAPGSEPPRREEPPAAPAADDAPDTGAADDPGQRRPAADPTATPARTPATPATALPPLGSFQRSPSLRPPPHASGARLTGRLHRLHPLQAAAAASTAASAMICAGGLGDMGAPDDSPVQRRNTASMDPRTPLRLTSPLVGAPPTGTGGLRHRTPSTAAGIDAGKSGSYRSQLAREESRPAALTPPRRSVSDLSDCSGDDGSIEGAPPRTSIGDLTAYGAVRILGDEDDCFDSVSQAGKAAPASPVHASRRATATLPPQSSSRKTGVMSPPLPSGRRTGVVSPPPPSGRRTGGVTSPLGPSAALEVAHTLLPAVDERPEKPIEVVLSHSSGAQAVEGLPPAPTWLPSSLQPLAQAAIVASRRRIRPTPKYRQSHLGNDDDGGAYDFAIVVRAVFTAKQSAALARAKADADARAAAALVQARQLGWASPTPIASGGGGAVLPPAQSGASVAMTSTPKRKPKAQRRAERGGSGSSGDSASLSDSDNLSDSSDGGSSHREAEDARVPGAKRPPKRHARRARPGSDDDYDHSSEDDDSPMRPSSARRRGRRGSGESEIDSALPSSDSGSGETSASTSGEDDDAGTTAAARRRGNRRGNSIGTFLAGLAPWGRASVHAPQPSDGGHYGSSDDSRLGRPSVLGATDTFAESDVGAGVGAASLRRVTFSNTEVTRDDAGVSDARRDGVVPPSAPHVSVDLPPSRAATARSHKCSEILAALRGAGLQAKRVRSLSRRTWLIKLRASEARLEEEAEAVRLRLRRRDGGWSRFRRSARAAFLPVIPEDDEGASRESGSVQSIFHSSDRQILIDHILRSSTREGGCDLGEGSPLGAYVTLMLPLHMPARLEELRNDWLATWRPAVSQGAHDRIGEVDPAWYAPPVLVSIDSAAVRPVVAAAGASSSWLHTLRESLGGRGGASRGPTSSAGASNDRGPEQSSASNDPPSVVAARSGRAGGVERDGGDPPRRHPRSCCSALCSTISCAFCCGPVVVAWLVVSFASCTARCSRSLTRCCCNLTSQPLDRIASYFGESIAFYFAWLEFYTQWLLVPAVAGVLLFIGQLYWGKIDIAYAPLFSLFVALWAIFLLEFWKRRNAELAQRWGVLHYENEEVVRPQFRGEWLQDTRTGEVVRLYPAWKRRAKHALTVPLFLGLLIAVAIMMITVFATRDQLLGQIETSQKAMTLYQAAEDYRAALVANASGVAVAAAHAFVMPSQPVPVDVSAGIRLAWSGGLVGLLQTGLFDSQSTVVTTNTSVTAAVSPALAAAAIFASDGLGADPKIEAAWTAYASAAGITIQTVTGDSLGSVASSTGTSSSAQAAFVVPSLTDSLSRVNAYFSSRGGSAWWVVMLVPPLIIGLLVPLLDNLFGALADRINDWENHATESQHRNHRVSKVFLWRFVTAFVSVYYYAFSPNHTLLQLAVQLGAFLIAGQLLGAARGLIVPATVRCCKEAAFRWRLRTAEETGVAEGRRGRRLMRHAKMAAWAESRLQAYDTFLCYARLLIQFGYVTFFSWTFPLAPALALAYNLILMRMEATQLCYHTQRPIAHKAGGIGVWASVLEAMVLLAVLTNCAHQALASRQFTAYFPTLDGGQKVLLIFIVEHAVLGLRLLLPYCVPPVPAAVRRRMARDALALARLQGRQSAGSAGAGSGAPLTNPVAGVRRAPDTHRGGDKKWPGGGATEAAAAAPGLLRRFSLGIQSFLASATGIAGGRRARRGAPHHDDDLEYPGGGAAVSVVQSAQGTYVMGNL